MSSLASTSLAYLLLGGLGLTQPAAGCPAALLIKELGDPPAGPRASLRLFARDQRGGGWHPIPLQVDPIDAAGRLIFYPPAAKDFLREPVEALDLISLRVDDFGTRLDQTASPLPCGDAVVHELFDPGRHRYAYLTNCGSRPVASAFPVTVSLDKSISQLQSPRYQYQFNPANYMQFSAIRFRTPLGVWEEVARDSRMLIRADVKHFFTMNFDSAQIESHLEDSRVGTLSNLGQVSFFLRILAFKIKMSLSTDVMFFGDSGHIPMMLSLPVDATRYLNAKSGILYSWIQSPAAQAGTSERQMPMLRPADIDAGPAALGKLGQSYCKGEECHYSYSVIVHGQRLSMDLLIGRDLVARGFFPFYVSDVGKVHEAMGWDMSDQPGARRSGLYFEVSGLKEGEHPWDFWLRLGTPGGEAELCPAPLRFSRISS